MLSPLPALAAPIAVERVVNPAQWALKPALDENRLVYVRAKGANSNTVWMKDLETGAVRRLSEKGRTAYAPDIQGRYVVWEEATRTGSVIVLHDFGTGKRRTITEGPRDYAPSIWGDTVVWTRERYSDAWLMTMDLHTGTERGLVEVSCGATSDIFDRTVAYACDGDIHTFDLKTGEKATPVSTPFTAEFPALHGDTLAYAHWEDGLSKIRLLNLQTGKSSLAVSGEGCAYAPAIWEDTIAWEAYGRPAGSEIRIGRLPGAFVSVQSGPEPPRERFSALVDGAARLARVAGSLHVIAIVRIFG